MDYPTPATGGSNSEPRRTLNNVKNASAEFSQDPNAEARRTAELKAYNQRYQQAMRQHAQRRNK